MILQSEPALTILAQALDEYRKRIADDIDSKKISSESRYDYELHLIQVENVMDSVEVEYNLLRKEKPTMIPFTELLKHKR